ncbi:hypothetical protein [Streptomyces sp. NPDC058401]|uniref:hypothetical protein n=1 Tax=Streptomyces sp. NPDC058401 TaxID=3346480 RepID=UPI00364CA564
MTQRLDPGAGWYGEFLRRDPEGMRACLDGAAMPPWDVLESLLGDLTASTGTMAIARETQYAAGLRAAAVEVWDRLPGGVEELRTLLVSAAEQQARARSALRVLSARLAESADPAQAQALSRELSWTRDDAARAAARHEDLTTRLETVAPEDGLPGSPPPGTPEPLHAVPAQRTATSPGADPAPAWPGPREGTQQGPRATGWATEPAGAGSGGPWDVAPEAGSGGLWDAASGGAWDVASGAGSGRASGKGWDTASGVGRDAASGAASDLTSGVMSDAGSGAASAPVPEGAEEPVRRAEGRWLRGGRRSGGARYAGAAEPEALAVVVPPGHPSSATPLRGARFGRPAREAAEPAPAGDPGPEQAASAAGAGQVAPTRGARHDDHTGRARGPLHEPAWSPAAGTAGRPAGDPGPTGQGGRPPGTPAWSAGLTPAPGTAPAPDPALRPHPQGGPTPWPDQTRAGGPPAASAQRTGSASGGGPHGAAPQWSDAASGGGPHGAAPQWSDSASGGGPRGAAPQWSDEASEGGPRGAGTPRSAGTSGGGPHGAAPQWSDAASGGPRGGGAEWSDAASGGPRRSGAEWSGAASLDGSRGGAQWGEASGGGGPQGFVGFVEGLVALRGQGRSGEAHVLLCEAAAGPAERLVRLGEELGRAGLAADWATLLWEAASLPPARFAAAAAALGPADRDALLRQGAARPAAEIAEAALVLAAAGHAEEADALLAAFVRVRTAEESARLARRDPRWFAPRLLRAAEALSGAHHRDLLHALRVANLPVA